jgi:hypothetical protein
MYFVFSISYLIEIVLQSTPTASQVRVYTSAELDKETLSDDDSAGTDPDLQACLLSEEETKFKTQVIFDFCLMFSITNHIFSICH